MSPSPALTFCRWRTGPQEIKLLSHREQHSQEETHPHPVLLTMGRGGVEIFPENFLEKIRLGPESARLILLTKRPYLRTALELTTSFFLNL